MESWQLCKARADVVLWCQMLLDLDDYVLFYHLLPQLPLQDLLSLRMVCKHLQASIDRHEWDERYFRDFPFDSVRLAGNGITRYARRYRAKAKHMGDIDRTGKWIANESYEKALKFFENTAIVDFHAFDVETACCEFVAARSLDANIYIHADSGADAVLETTGLSMIHLCGDELIAWKDNVPMICDLTATFFEDEYDENDEPIPRVRPNEDLELEEHVTSVPDDVAYQQLEKSAGSRTQTSLYASDPLLVYFRNRSMFDETRVEVQKKVLSLMEQLPGALETLWFFVVDSPEYVVAGSSGSTLCVIFGEGNTKRIKSYKLPARIIKIDGFRYYQKEGQVCDINVLDSRGDVYCCRFEGIPPTRNDIPWMDRPPINPDEPPSHHLFYPESVEPFKVTEHVADLAGTSILMEDGTIKCFHGFFKCWMNMQATNAVLITDRAYLTVS